MVAVAAGVEKNGSPINAANVADELTIMVTDGVESTGSPFDTANVAGDATVPADGVKATG